MIKALFDTNVLVSGFVSFKRPTRPPAQLLHLWQAGLFELCTSEHIIAEFTRTLQRPYFRSRLEPEDINEAMVLLNEDCKVIPITNLVQGITAHPEDDLTIAAALSAKVDYLVTGDKLLLNKLGNSYQGVSITSPNDFLRNLK